MKMPEKHDLLAILAAKTEHRAILAFAMVPSRQI